MPDGVAAGTCAGNGWLDVAVGSAEPSSQARWPSGSSAPCATYLVAASDGNILRRLVTGMDFSQSVFAGGMLVSANDNGVYAWHVEQQAAAT